LDCNFNYFYDGAETCSAKKQIKTIIFHRYPYFYWFFDEIYGLKARKKPGASNKTNIAMPLLKRSVWTLDQIGSSSRDIQLTVTFELF
jgi:hypothetical protein